MYSVRETIGDPTAFRIVKDDIAAAEMMICGEIIKKYGKNPITIVGVKKGAERFAQRVVSLLNANKSQARYASVFARSYVGDKQMKKVMIAEPPSWHLIHKQNVIVLDDIFDSGKTLAMVGVFFTRQYKVKGIECGALIVKGNGADWINPKYCGFNLPPDAPFLVGYGMDYNERYRDEDEIRLLREDEKTEEDRELEKRAGETAIAQEGMVEATDQPVVYTPAEQPPEETPA